VTLHGRLMTFPTGRRAFLAVVFFVAALAMVLSLARGQDRPGVSALGRSAVSGALQRHHRRLVFPHDGDQTLGPQRERCLDLALVPMPVVDRLNATLGMIDH
jgi:hypothetical protein